MTKQNKRILTLLALGIGGFFVYRALQKNKSEAEQPAPRPIAPINALNLTPPPRIQQMVQPVRSINPPPRVRPGAIAL